MTTSNSSRLEHDGSYYIQIMKIWINIRTNHYSVEGKLWDKKKIRDSSWQGLSEAFWYMLGRCRSFLIHQQTVVAWVVTPTMPAAPWALSPTRNSMSSFSYDLQMARGGTQSVPSAHTLWQGNDLGWVDGVGEGTCLQMFHRAGNWAIA